MEIRPGRTARRILNPRVMARWKFMIVAWVLLFGIAKASTTTADITKFDDFDSQDVIMMADGQIVEFSNDDTFCRSWILPPGFSLYHWSILAIFYFLALCYLFLGIAIIADIFML